MAMLGFDLFTIISGLAVIMMLIAVVKAYDYRRSIPGGRGRESLEGSFVPCQLL
jgi:hypothetical protein